MLPTLCKTFYMIIKICMKNIFKTLCIALPFLACTQTEERMTPEKSIYDYEIKDINGNAIDLSQFEGKKILGLMDID